MSQITLFDAPDPQDAPATLDRGSTDPQPTVDLDAILHMRDEDRGRAWKERVG